MHILLTGGHSGIGLELSKLLLAEGHHLGLVLRSQKRQADAEAELGQDAPIDYFFADLSKRDEVEGLADQVAAKWSHIDGLYNNAGVLLDQAYYSPQGYEMHMEVNTLTPYYLTRALAPLLNKAERPFVINTATGGLHSQKKIDIPNLRKPVKFVKLLGSYRFSKFAMVLLMNHLAKEMPELRILSVDPGPNKTKMTQGGGMPKWLLPLRNLFFPPATKGASLMYKAAFEPAFQQVSGQYISGNKVKPLSYAFSEAELEALLAPVTAS